MIDKNSILMYFQLKHRMNIQKTLDGNNIFISNNGSVIINKILISYDKLFLSDRLLIFVIGEENKIKVQYKDIDEIRL